MARLKHMSNISQLIFEAAIDKSKTLKYGLIGAGLAGAGIYGYNELNPDAAELARREFAQYGMASRTFGDFLRHPINSIRDNMNYLGITKPSDFREQAVLSSWNRAGRTF